MAKTAEHKKVVKVKGKVTRVNILDGGDAVEILYHTADSTESKATSRAKNQNKAKVKLSFEEKFPIVRASELSLEDAFLKHEPTTYLQKRLKDSIIAGIKAGLKDFRCPAMDPSLDKHGNLVYEVGRDPAVGNSAKFWAKKLKQFMPERNSRMGTVRERDALLGFLIKYLIEEQGYEVAEAWKAVCDDSRNLGHYRNSKNAKHDFEATGSRKVWLFWDWANTCKVIADNNSASAFWHGGGNYIYNGECSLAGVDAEDDPNYDYGGGVAWLVLDV